SPTPTPTPSLHDALPICTQRCHFLACTPKHQRIAGFQPHNAFAFPAQRNQQAVDLFLAFGMAALALADGKALSIAAAHGNHAFRSEEHTSELQSRENLVC